MNGTIDSKKRLKIRDKHSNKTYKEVMKLTRQGTAGKCMVIRPTGFGKSYMLAKITQNSEIINNGGKALYVYPYDTIKSDIEQKYGENGTSDVRLQSTEFMTYKTFTQWGQERKGNKLIKYLNKENIRILLLDEVHLAGAEGFKQTYENIKHKLGPGQGKIRLIGVTATPHRMDGFDILNEIFEGHKVYDYTMDDAIADGLMLKPIYKSSLQTEDIIKDIVSEYNKRYIRIDKEILERKAFKLIQTQDRIDLDEMLHPEKCIRNSICKVLNTEKPEYLKFIVFFPTIDSMDTMKDKVSNYFSGAFPYLRQNIVSVSSRKGSDEVDELHDLERREGYIDLIFCVNKINMGYHVDDINGLMMLRGTRSDIIYKQQIGRCMSVTSNIRPVIFDMVNNISKKPYYKTTQEDLKDIEESELDSQLTGDTDQKDIEVSEGSLDLDVDSHDYSEILDEITEELNKQIIDEICWLYEKLKVPIYKLSGKYCGTGTLKKELVQMIVENGIEVEDETHLREIVGPKVSRKLLSLTDRRGK